MMTIEPLAPCPHCGGTVQGMKHSGFDRTWAVICRGCKALGPAIDQGTPGVKALAARAWNERAEPTSTGRNIE